MQEVSRNLATGLPLFYNEYVLFTCYTKFELRPN